MARFLLALLGEVRNLKRCTGHRYICQLLSTNQVQMSGRVRHLYELSSALSVEDKILSDFLEAKYLLTIFSQ